MAEHIIIKSVQHEVYAEEIRCIQKTQDLAASSLLKKLYPVIDEEGLLHVGGCIIHTKLTADETHLLLIPGKHHVAVLLIRHYHRRVQHQGRHFTAGEVGASGL